MKKIRTLRAEEIEVRPQSVKNNKANMLLYINSRSATDLLDETYSMENWMIEYKDVAGQIYGRLSVYDTETERWVVREDTGSESNVEAEKGLASDILKRCIVRLGVTELYSSPKIQWEDDGYGNTGYKVTEIEYDDRRNITHLVIVNRFGKEQFRWDRTQKIQMVQQVTNNTQEDLEWREDVPVKDNKTLLTEFCGQMTNNGYDRHQVGNFFRYYEKKCGTWNGKFDVEKLFSNWMSKAA
jgi:hypothetical protein